MIFADNAALVSYTQKGIQCIKARCNNFALTISIKKTEVMSEDAEIPPSIYIDGPNFSLVDNFKYLE